MSQVESPEKRTYYCSFCGKSQHEVKKIIAGPTVFICDECTGLCINILVDEKIVTSEQVVELDKLKKIRSEIEDAISMIDKAAAPLRIEQAVIGHRLDKFDALQESLQALLTRSAEESTSLTTIPIKTEPAPPPLES